LRLVIQGWFFRVFLGLIAIMLMLFPGTVGHIAIISWVVETPMAVIHPAGWA
jgi:hypothetical protein